MAFRFIPYATCFWIASIVCLLAVSCLSGCQRENPISTAAEFSDEALAIDASGAEYPQEYVNRLGEFYSNGTFQEDYVTALLGDIFSERKPNDERDLRNPLDPVSAKRFRDLIRSLLATAETDLTEEQRARLLKVVKMAGVVQ